MNLFGIGTAELIIIIVLMLVVAGPKRMVQWAYIAGQQVARLREMWNETRQLLEKELEQAGMDPEVTQTLRQLSDPRALRQKNPLKEVGRMITDPLEQTLKEVGDTPLMPAPQTQPASNTKPVQDTPATAETASPPAQRQDQDSQDAQPRRYDAWTPN